MNLKNNSILKKSQNSTTVQCDLNIRNTKFKNIYDNTHFKRNAFYLKVTKNVIGGFKLLFLDLSLVVRT